MARGFFKKGKKLWAQGGVAWLASGGSDIRAYLIDTAGGTANLTTMDTLSDLTTAGAATVGSPVALTLIDAADDGIIDANDISFTGLSGAPTIEAVVLVKYNSGTPSASKLLIWLDEGTGLVIAAGATQVDVAWPNGTNKIARI